MQNMIHIVLIVVLNKIILNHNLIAYIIIINIILILYLLIIIINILLIFKIIIITIQTIHNIIIINKHLPQHKIITKLTNININIHIIILIKFIPIIIIKSITLIKIFINNLILIKHSQTQINNYSEKLLILLIEYLNLVILITKLNNHFHQNNLNLNYIMIIIIIIQKIKHLLLKLITQVLDSIHLINVLIYTKIITKNINPHLICT